MQLTGEHIHPYLHKFGMRMFIQYNQAFQGYCPIFVLLYVVHTTGISSPSSFLCKDEGKFFLLLTDLKFTLVSSYYLYLSRRSLFHPSVLLLLVAFMQRMSDWPGKPTLGHTHLISMYISAFDCFLCFLFSFLCLFNPFCYTCICVWICVCVRQKRTVFSQAFSTKIARLLCPCS